MYPIKQSAAITILFFVHDAAGDAVTGLTNASFTKRISKGSGAFAAMTVTITEKENGWYSFPLSTTHSNTLGLLTILFTNAGAKQVNLQWRVEAKLIDDLQDLTAAEVNTEVDSALADYDAPTNAELIARTLVTADYFAPATDEVKLSATGLDAIASTATGMVEIAKAIWDRLLTGATHNIATSAGRRLRGLQDFGVYESGLVWVDSINGVAGTVDFENGTTNNPSLTMADAITLRTSLNAPGWHIIPGSVIVLPATINAGEMFGIGYSLTLGGRNVNNMHFFGSISVTGIGTAATGMSFHDCIIGTVSLQKAHCIDCSFVGVVTMTLAGAYRYINSQSGVAGAGTAVFNKTAGQVITAEWRRWSGSITVSGIEAGDVMTIAGDTLGNIVLNGADGDVKIVGIYESYTDNRTGAPVLTIEGAIKGSNVATIVEDTGTTLPALIGTPAADLAADLAAIKVVVDAGATAAALAIVDGIVDAILADTAAIGPIVSAILVDTGTDIPALIAALNDPTVAAIVAGIWSDNLTTYVDGEAGARVRKLTDLAGLEVTVNDAAATTNSFITDQTGVNLEDSTLKFLDGANAEQSKVITTHNTTTGEMTFDEPFDTAPANGAAAITGLHVHSITQIQNAILASGDVDGFTIEETLRIVLASAAAKLSGAGTTTIIIRAADDSKARITSTVELIGNRTAVILDGTP